MPRGIQPRFFGGVEEEPDAHRQDRWNDYLCWALIIIGAALRIGQSLHHRSLWLDESLLAVNVNGARLRWYAHAVGIQPKRAMAIPRGKQSHDRFVWPDRNGFEVPAPDLIHRFAVGILACG